MISILQMLKGRFQKVEAKVTNPQDDLAISHPNRDTFDKGRKC